MCSHILNAECLGNVARRTWLLFQLLHAEELSLGRGSIRYTFALAMAEFLPLVEPILGGGHGLVVLRYDRMGSISSYFLVK